MPASEPFRILDTLCAYWQTETLIAAIDLGVFTALGRQSRTAADLARRCDADEARLGRLCDALVSLGFLRVEGRRYRSTADAARFLDAGSPHSIVEARRFFNGGPVATGFGRLAERLRRHRGTAPRARGEPWRLFADATAPLRRHLALAIARELQSRRLIHGRILDIGAGASPVGIELLRRRRSATLVVQDRPAVVKVALRDAAAAGVAERVTAIAGDAGKMAWGGPYDLVLMINVLDYHDASARSTFLRKARTALRPGGVLAVYAPLLDDRRTSPPDAVAYDLLLLALVTTGGASTYEELRAQLRRAGLVSVTRCRGLPLVLARPRRS